MFGEQHMCFNDEVLAVVENKTDQTLIGFIVIQKLLCRCDTRFSFEHVLVHQLIRHAWKEIRPRYGGDDIFSSFSSTCGNSNDTASKSVISLFLWNYWAFFWARPNKNPKYPKQPKRAQ